MTPERKAAFERLVDALIEARDFNENEAPYRAALTAFVEREIAEAQIENATQVALAAIRMEAGRQERLGEVYEVVNVGGICNVTMDARLFNHGDRVRVVRVEDAAHPEEEK